MFMRYILLGIFLFQNCIAEDFFIIDGHEALPHQYPYQVIIYAKLKIPLITSEYPVCGGVIISPEWILTSAQCLPGFSYLTVKAGKQNLAGLEAGQEERSVKLTIVHKEYRSPGFFHKVPENDIALLRLDRAFTFNDYVKAVALPTSEKKHTGIGFLTGWGNLNITQETSILQAARVPFLSSDTCTEVIHSSYDKVTITDKQICSGPIGGNISPCTIDKGGPVVQYNGEAIPELVGIISWFDLPCGVNGLPTVYTRVSSYINWINEKLRV